MDEQEGGLRRPTGWYEVWRSMQKSTRKRELLQKCHRWASGWTPARLKRRGARGVFPARIRDPFESGTIQSEVPRLWKESLLHRPGLAGWYILFFSPHMHTFTVQRCPVCILKVRGHQRQKTPRPQARDPPQVTPREKRSCSHWCQTEGVSRLPVTGKSHLKVKNKNKSPRR